MTNDLWICRLDDLTDPGSRGFSIEHGNATLEGFVVQKDGQFFACKNNCPHTGAPLDWIEHQFLDLDGELIQCAVHDARFTIHDGACVAGPCSGDFLQKLEIEIREDSVYLLS